MSEFSPTVHTVKVSPGEKSWVNVYPLCTWCRSSSLKVWVNFHEQDMGRVLYWCTAKVKTTLSIKRKWSYTRGGPCRGAHLYTKVWRTSFRESGLNSGMVSHPGGFSSGVWLRKTVLILATAVNTTVFCSWQQQLQATPCPVSLQSQGTYCDEYDRWSFRCTHTSPDIILCGWLGSKHQLPKYTLCCHTHVLMTFIKRNIMCCWAFVFILTFTWICPVLSLVWSHLLQFSSVAGKILICCLFRVLLDWCLMILD